MMGDWGDVSCSDPNLILQASCFDRMMYDGLEVGSYRSEIPRYAAQHDTGWRSTDPVPTRSRQIWKQAIVHRALGTSISTIQEARVHSSKPSKQRTQGISSNLDLWDVSRQTWRHRHPVDDYISISGSTVRKSQEKARKRTHRRQSCWFHHCSPSFHRHLSWR